MELHDALTVDEQPGVIFFAAMGVAFPPRPVGAPRRGIGLAVFDAVEIFCAQRALKAEVEERGELHVDDGVEQLRQRRVILVAPAHVVGELLTVFDLSDEDGVSALEGLAGVAGIVGIGQALHIERERVMVEVADLRAAADGVSVFLRVFRYVVKPAA